MESYVTDLPLSGVANDQFKINIKKTTTLGSSLMCVFFSKTTVSNSNVTYRELSRFSLWKNILIVSNMYEGSIEPHFWFY